MNKNDPNLADGDNEPAMGVFAKTDIAANELLMQIPREAFIQVWDTKREVDDSWEVYYHNFCLLAKKLKKEMLLGEDSEYAPYIRYLKHQATGKHGGRFILYFLCRQSLVII